MVGMAALGCWCCRGLWRGYCGNLGRHESCEGEAEEDACCRWCASSAARSAVRCAAVPLPVVTYVYRSAFVHCSAHLHRSADSSNFLHCAAYLRRAAYVFLPATPYKQPYLSYAGFCTDAYYWQRGCRQRDGSAFLPGDANPIQSSVCRRSCVQLWSLTCLLNFASLPTESEPLMPSPIIFR